ncbi:MAG: hypothetical protein ACPGU4_03470 [Flavobacteriales bacterium]
MKNLLPIFLIATVFTGCQLFDELRTFDIDYSVDFTIPGSSVVNLPINLPTPPITTNAIQKFEDEGIETNWIESIKLKELKLTLINPSGEDFDFLENVNIYISSDGEAEQLLASKSPVPEGSGSMISLDVNDVNLFAHITQPNFSLRIEVVTDEARLYDVDVKANMKMEVKATIPGT